MNKDFTVDCVVEGGGGSPYNGLYVEAPPDRGTFFQVSGI